MQFVEVLDVLMVLKKDKAVKVSIEAFYHFRNVLKTNFLAVRSY